MTDDCCFDVVEVDVTVDEVVIPDVVAAVDIVVEEAGVGPRGPEGPQGPPGADGAAGGSYVHEQGTPSAVWSIAHNLGYHPGELFVKDSSGTQIEGVRNDLDVNNLEILFLSSFGGTAYVS